MGKIKDNFLNYFDVEKVDNYTFAIKESKIFYKANCFLLIDGSEGILIDALTGVYPNFISSLEHIFKVKIRKLYLTHAHYDHFGGYDGRIIKEVYVSKYESEYLKKYYLSNSYVRKEIMNNGKSILPNSCNIKNYKVKKILKISLMPKEIIFGNRKLKVIETPGHSKGSLCFYEESTKYLFTGDFIYLGDIDIFEDPSSSFSDYIESLNKCKDIKVSKYLCGHNQAIINGSEIDIEDLYKMLYESSKNNKVIDCEKYHMKFLLE